jgi:hypothetical protein
MAQDLSWLREEEPVSLTIDGHVVKFYPLSQNAIFKLKGFGANVAKVTAALYRDPSADHSTIQTTSGLPADGTAEPGDTVTSIVQRQAINPDLAKERHRQLEVAGQAFSELVAGEDTGVLLMYFVMDSCRELFGRKVTLSAAQENFHEGMFSAPKFIEFIKGVAKANESVLVPLGLSGWAQSLLARSESLQKVINAKLDSLAVEEEQAKPETDS